MFSKKEFAIASNLRFISKFYAQLSSACKKFYNLKARPLLFP